MPDLLTYDYAVVRIVPRVERGEFVNAGVIMSCAAKGYLEVRIELEDARLLALDPSVDLEAIKANLSTIPAICMGGEKAGPIGRLSVRERFHWLVAPRSTIIQTSAVHMGRCTDLGAALERLLDKMVRPPSPSSLSPNGNPQTDL